MHLLKRKYGFVCFGNKSVFFFFLLLGNSAVLAQPSGDMHSPVAGAYEQDLVRRAEKMKLYNDPYWHTLLHYKWTLTGKKSLVDDPRFFISPDGKRNPEKEMKALIHALFQTVPEGEKSIPCRFTARYAWLKEKLGFDDNRIPQHECEEFIKLIRNIRPVSTTLVFPTFHINSPASMFGHTFISIDTATPSRLLSYAVNYAAVTGDTPGPFYALLGTFGFYRGYFSSLPYYTKVAEYGDFDFRDIWEYPLSFSRDEVVRMMMHIVELDNIYSDYYFFDENCSYNLLFLIDAARPSLSLTDNRGLWVIPVDTMRRAQKNGLLKEVKYRPSRVTRIRYIASRLSAGNRERAIALSKGKGTADTVIPVGASDLEKTMMLDLAIEYMKYLYSKGEINKPAYQERLISLLGARSGQGNPEGSDYRIPAPQNPLEGHRSNRLMAGAGYLENRIFTEMRYRPAYHTLIDSDEGYLRSGQIIFTDVIVRYYPEERQFQFQGVDIVDICSLAPRDMLFKSFSWKISARIIRLEPSSGKDYLVGDLNFGGGMAWNVPYLGILYFMAEPDIMAGPDLRDRYSGGIGGSAGILFRAGSFWKMHIYARDIYYPVGHVRNAFEAVMEQRFRISTNNAVIAGVSAKKDFEKQWMEYSLGWNLYF